jgi:hypothetical protein
LRYSYGKKKKVSADHLEVKQDGPPDRIFANAQIEIHSQGLIAVEINVSGAEEGTDAWNRGFSSSFEVLETDVSAALASAFRFSERLYDSIDRYKRYSSFLFDVALIGLGNKKLVARRSEGNSGTFGMIQLDWLIAFETPRKIARATLVNPEAEIKRVLHELRHRQEAERPY